MPTETYLLNAVDPLHRSRIERLLQGEKKGDYLGEATARPDAAPQSTVPGNDRVAVALKFCLNKFSRLILLTRYSEHCNHSLIKAQMDENSMREHGKKS